MLSRESVGQRFRQVRVAQNKTLRDVEGASGFSSTHISEIERGRTSPTVGALMQIAQALNKPACYFIEERELEEVSVTNPGERVVSDPQIFDLSGSGLQLESMTHGILGGRLLAYELTIEVGGEGTVTRMPELLDCCIVVLDGRLEVGTGARRLPMSSGDSLHAMYEQPFTLRNTGDRALRTLLFLDPGTVAP